MRRILFVEDDRLIADAVAIVLRAEGFDTTTVGDGSDALQEALRGGYDLVLLDLSLPGMPGMELLRALRGHTSIPIVIVTARTSEVDRVLGLEHGADDYIMKPFSMAELLARIRATLRGRELAQPRTDRGVGGLRIELGRREVFVRGRLVSLTPSEFTLLMLLAEQPGRVVTRWEIVSTLWGGDFVGEMRVADQHVARLRRKLALAPDDPAAILTVRGVGYRLRASTPVAV